MKKIRLAVSLFCAVVALMWLVAEAIHIARHGIKPESQEVQEGLREMGK